MSSEQFVPMTQEAKECFRRYIDLKEKFLVLTRKVTDARQACDNAQTYRLRLVNKGLDPDSEIFSSIKIDQRLIEAYLEIMDRYLLRISRELELLYKIFLGTPITSFKRFYDRENTINRLFDIVVHAESKCMKRRQDFVSRCLDALNPFLTNMLDSFLSL